ncbi:ribokinase [Bradyrhizobium liaoningense]
MSVPSEFPNCLVVGALNLDVLGRVQRFCGRDEAVELEDVVSTPGGHAGNFAAALCRLGGRARILACVGNDAAGDGLIRTLQSGGVDTNAVQRTTAAPTGTVFIPVLPDGDKALYMALGANRHLTLDRIDEAADDCSAVVVFDPPAGLLPGLARVVSQRCGIFAPGGVLAESPRNVLKPMLEAASYLVLNGPEARIMSGLDDPRRAAERLAATAGINTVVTIGAAGCWFAPVDASAAHCPSVSVDAVDTTGAGDAFVAGFCGALQAGEPVQDALRFGCAAGALAVRGFGAQSTHATSAEVRATLAPAGLQLALEA